MVKALIVLIRMKTKVRNSLKRLGAFALEALKLIATTIAMFILLPISMLLTLVIPSVRKTDMNWWAKVSLVVNMITSKLSRYPLRFFYYIKSLFIVLLVVLLSTTSCKTREYINIIVQEKDSTQVAIMSETKEAIDYISTKVQDLKITVSELANQEEITIIIERDSAGSIIRETHTEIRTELTKDAITEEKMVESMQALLDRINEIDFELHNIKELIVEEDIEVNPENKKSKIAEMIDWVSTIIMTVVFLFGISLLVRLILDKRKS